MNPNLLELINSYYELTGKPVASMTVSEYLQFVASLSTIQPALIPNLETSRDNFENVHKPVAVSDRVEKPVSFKPVSSEKKETAKTKPSETGKSNAALEMLRSISG